MYGVSRKCVGEVRGDRGMGCVGKGVGKYVGV